MIITQLRERREGYHCRNNRPLGLREPESTNDGDFRSAVLQDVDKIVALEELCFDYDRLSKANVRHLVRSNKATIWVAGHGDEVDGYIITLYHKSRKHARIYSVAVHPRCRGLGLGSKLVAFVEQEVLARNLGEVKLEVKPDNHAALKVYLSAGYQITGKIEHYYTDGTDAIVCCKQLRSTLIKTPRSHRLSVEASSLG